MHADRPVIIPEAPQWLRLVTPEAHQELWLVSDLRQLFNLDSGFPMPMIWEFLTVASQFSKITYVVINNALLHIYTHVAPKLN